MERQDGKTALVTGSTDGVGRVVAKTLSARGVRVLVHGRDASGASASSPRSRRPAVPRVPRRGSVRARRGAATCRRGAAGDRPARPSRQQRRHRLRRCAGRAADQRRWLRIAVRRELPRRLPAHRSAPAADQAKCARPHRQRLLARPAGHRLCRRDVDPRLQRLARLLPEQARADHVHDRSRATSSTGSGVTVNALHPATYMDTTMVRQSGVTPISSVEEGAQAILKLATSPELDGRSGLFFSGQREARADPQAYDAEARQRLKAASVKLVSPPPTEATSAARSSTLKFSAVSRPRRLPRGRLAATFRHLPLRRSCPSSGKKEPRLNVGAKSSSELVDHAPGGGPLRERGSTIPLRRQVRGNCSKSDGNIWHRRCDCRPTVMSVK